MLERQRSARPRSRLLWPGSLGLLGTTTIALTSPQLVADPVRWWYAPHLGGAARLLCYAGMLAVVIAWLRLAKSDASGHALGLVAIGWSVPLLLGPPLFSHDLFSYLAQGTIANLGRSPYEFPPVVLVHLGHANTLHAVSPFWRRTTAPYGPLFVALVREIVSLTGNDLVLGTVLVRLVDFLGLILMARYVPRLAAALGASPRRAAWLVVLNPLILFELVSPGHNDLLMVGGLVLGVLLAVEGRPLVAIAVCVLASTVKVPALMAAAFIAVAWIRSLPDLQAKVRAIVQSAAASVAVLALVSWVSGFGTDWLSSSVFSTPNRVHLAITPSTALGWTIAQIAHGLDLHVSTRHLESAFALVSLAIVALVALKRAARVDVPTLPRHLGVVLIALALGGPAAWPWYFAWGIALLAACPPGRLAAAVPIGSLIGAFIVKPDGILGLPIESAPAVLVLYAVCAAYGWRVRPHPPERVVHAAA